MKRLLSCAMAALLVLAAGCSSVAGPVAAPATPTVGGPSASEGAAPAATTPTELPRTAQAATPPDPAQAPAAPSPAQAKAPAGAGLRRVLDRGRLIVGVKFDAPTFGLLNPATNQLEGFEIDLARAIARELLGDPDRIEFKQAIAQDRVSYLEQGIVDLVAATMAANEARAQLVLLTDTYYIAGQTLLVPKSSEVRGLGSLGGKAVGAVRDSTSERNVRDRAPQANVVPFNTYSEAVAAMNTGRLQAVTMDDGIAFGYAALAPERYKVVGGSFTTEPFVMGVAKHDPELLNAINAGLRKIVSSGEWARLYDKHFGALGLRAPAPPPQNWRDVASRPPGA